MNVILERYPYRYVECGTLENGFPDYRIQKFNEYSQRYRDMYLLDNSTQLDYAMEDFEYTKLLESRHQKRGWNAGLKLEMDMPKAVQAVDGRKELGRKFHHASPDPINQ